MAYQNAETNMHFILHTAVAADWLIVSEPRDRCLRAGCGRGRRKRGRARDIHGDVW